MTDPAVRPNDSVLVRRLSDGESVLLNMADERYYGLNATGTKMWEALVEHGSVEGAHDALQEFYDVDRSELLDDLRELVLELEQAGLLLIGEAGSPDAGEITLG